LFVYIARDDDQHGAEISVTKILQSVSFIVGEAVTQNTGVIDTSGLPVIGMKTGGISCKAEHLSVNAFRTERPPRLIQVPQTQLGKKLTGWEVEDVAPLVLSWLGAMLSEAELHIADEASGDLHNA
jgi:hypothetical protein